MTTPGRYARPVWFMVGINGTLLVLFLSTHLVECFSAEPTGTANPTIGTSGEKAVRTPMFEPARARKADIQADSMFIQTETIGGPECIVEPGNFTTYSSLDGKHYAAWPNPPPDAKRGSCCKLVVVPCKEEAGK